MATTTGNGSQGGDGTGGLTWENYVAMGAATTFATISGGGPVAYAVAKHATQTDGYSIVWDLITSLVDTILAKGVELITKLQGSNTAGFFDLLQALISDLLGIELPADALANAWKRGGDIGGMRAAGSALFNILLREFGAGPITAAGPGVTAAVGFLGYGMGFSVREANVSVFTSLIPEEYRFLDGLREYGVTLAKNLSLGRLTRLALQPLMKIAVADPLTRELNASYFPTYLGAPQAIKAWARGVYSDQDLADELAADGYNSKRAAALKVDNLGQLGQAEIYEFFKWGLIDQPTALSYIAKLGVDPAQTSNWLTAEELKEADPYILQLVQDWKTQRANGYLTAGEFNSLVDELQIGSQTKIAIKNAVGTVYERPRKRATLAEMEKWYLESIIDISEYQDFLAAEGYSDADQLNFQIALLLKQSDESSKLAAAEYRYHKAVLAADKKGLPPPPPPPGVGAWSPPASP